MTRNKRQTQIQTHSDEKNIAMTRRERSLVWRQLSIGCAICAMENRTFLQSVHAKVCLWTRAVSDAQYFSGKKMQNEIDGKKKMSEKWLEK